MSIVSHIQLDQLVESAANVRRTGRTEGIEELAASIAAHGLRQNLNVRQLEAEPGTYEVIAGQRRLLALRKLAEAGTIDGGYMVPCLILAADEDADEISLAENEVRVAMHPADQFDAFKKLADKGTSIEDIAARFGVTPTVVSRRLKLANVSPKLVQLYRDGEMDLDALMAFTLTDDHARQEAVWEDEGDYASCIRRALTENTKRASARISRFVGIEAYEAAGGEVIRDLFDDENAGFLTDEALLTRLADEKLEAEAEKVRAEGWAWVQVELERSYSYYPTVRPIRCDDADDIEDGEESDTAPVYASEDIARAGAIVSIGHDGTVHIRRGLLIEEDTASRSASGKPKAAPGDFNAKQVQELTAHRTAAIRLELIRQPGIALRALAHKLAIDMLMRFSFSGESCLKVHGSRAALSNDVPNPEECPAHAQLDVIAESWRYRLPEDRDALWTWVLEQDDTTVTDLIVAATAISAYAVVRKDVQGVSAGKLDHSHRLAEALNLDMAEHWTPAEDGFIGRMNKRQMVHALISTLQPEPLIASVQKMKTPAAAAATAKALEGKRWLPSPMRKAEGSVQ